jgi:hypothetical protein
METRFLYQSTGAALKIGFKNLPPVLDFYNPHDRTYINSKKKVNKKVQIKF